MSKQIIFLKCPFCKKGEIEAIYFPSVLRSRKGSWGGYKPKFERSADSIIITSDKCPNCRKTRKEIQKKIKGEEEMDHKKVVDRMKKQGLPTQIEF